MAVPLAISQTALAGIVRRVPKLDSTGSFDYGGFLYRFSRMTGTTDFTDATDDSA
jgi:hypothetical protein